MVYKLLYGMVDCNYRQFFKLKDSITRGHDLTLSVKCAKTTLAKHFFAYRIISPWNYLPNDVITAPNFKVIKNRLSKINLTRFLKRGDLDVID